jgi:hypothetical protein
LSTSFKRGKRKANNMDMGSNAGPNYEEFLGMTFGQMMNTLVEEVPLKGNVGSKTTCDN